MRKMVAIVRPNGLRPAFGQLWLVAKEAVLSRPLTLTLSDKRSRRSLEQNNKMWAMLTDISKQVQWPVNGVLTWMSTEEWKDVLSAAVKQANGEGMRIAQGVDGGFVFLGQRTSRMSVKELGELIEFMYAFGSDRNVLWSEPIPKEWFELQSVA